MASVFGYSLPLLLVVAGVALCVAEAMAPGAHLIVLGVALLVAGLVGLLLGGPGGALPYAAEPLALAALILVFGAIALYVYRGVDIYAGDDSGRTQSSESYKGREGVVTQRVTRSAGRIRLHDGGFDPTFSARTRSGEIPEGTDVVVVDPGGGSVLTVEPVEAQDDEGTSTG